MNKRQQKLLSTLINENYTDVCFKDFHTALKPASQTPSLEIKQIINLERIHTCDLDTKLGISQKYG